MLTRRHREARAVHLGDTVTKTEQADEVKPLSRMNKDELVEQAKARGLKEAGTNADLKARIKAHDDEQAKATTVPAEQPGDAEPSSDGGGQADTGETTPEDTES